MQTSTADLLRTARPRSRKVFRAWQAAKHLKQQDQLVTSATMDHFSIGFDRDGPDSAQIGTNFVPNFKETLQPRQSE